ncbi:MULTISPECIES: NTP transferase domain-containing protein [Pasteurellaceae]|uniref:NTP transferase domain-containing protein n=1 Tax=Pasteurella atlantica TaxID=2827233 RepID=A0AAW8CS52_9PAST|nr:NTP transferase domain-containing protein [Pasteurella atlantica]MBR0574570.1 NTP transferase domain-containing protein [Pasteurella atlantica]MDP8040434.1 NTP transferase domain-containing protein [Pasteurella atlantica]MDP8042600.1 NTP transferase domain-containing protein [Pasteurella atlantica]MDP8044705.1 NTP transferase domain-containing protein [Pasteurella atlantica]MDP8046753.1 NTP transferase domain-containing protein [Pasteurella atlantica]
MNAIILAAGLGSRFKDITQKTHKALLPINEVPNIERTIIYLHEAGITNIYIVTGHLAEQFSYLSDKYGCHLLKNDKYREYNNIYSFYRAMNYFNNSYVIDSDVVLFKNIFKKQRDQSCYFVIERPDSSDKEWVPVLSSNKVIQIKVTNECEPSLLGISYWAKPDCDKIKDEFINYLEKETLLNPKLYWDNIPMEIIQDLNVTTEQIPLSEGYEMDNLIQYHFILDNLARKKNEKN